MMLCARRIFVNLTGLAESGYAASKGASLGALVLLMLSLWMSPLTAHAEDEGDLSKTGAELSNPLGVLWALSASFGAPQFYDGQSVSGGARLGANMLFQPIMPVPLYGTGASELRLITRPIVPLFFSQPIPKGRDTYEHVGGLGDIQLPLLLSAPESIAGNFILGAGPVGMLPTATDYHFGKGQWAIGPAAVLGYKNKYLTAGVFPNYFWKIGSSYQRTGTPDINQGSMLYFLVFNLPNAWQIGTNPTITYDHQASDDNKWNVPVGLFVGKTVKLGNTPVNFKLGFEYSVVSQRDYGQRAQIRLQITPVIAPLIKTAIFGK